MTIRFDARDGIALITLDRPEVRNAFDLPTAEALADACDELDARDDLTVGVLTATGTVFSAGMDLKAFNETGKRPITARRGALGILEKPPTKPVIAAVEGKAVGGGFEMALACDMIVAGADAEFGLPEVKRGLVASGGGLLRLPRRIPRAIAMEIVLTACTFDARRAAELGLVNRVVAPGTVVEEAVALAKEIAGNAPLAVRVGKQIMDESIDWPVVDSFTRQASLADVVRSSKDADEGVRAFLEKRAPVWVGA
ncbi:crotonase/enoyl-CoA hydratase family protein [Mycobacterium syngnathidarum]